MLAISPLKLLVLATIFGCVLAVGVTVVLVGVQAPDALKSLVPLAGILPTVFAGLIKLFNRIDQVERTASRRIRHSEATAQLAVKKADEAIGIAKENLPNDPHG